jgi:hypothetical protein
MASTAGASGWREAHRFAVTPAGSDGVGSCASESALTRIASRMGAARSISFPRRRSRGVVCADPQRPNSRIQSPQQQKDAFQQDRRTLQRLGNAPERLLEFM